jgi:DNA-binding PadR family transcriptional regulator
MNDRTPLTHTSHIVLGLLSLLAEATPYDLKRLASISIGNFWSLPHSQLYAEPARLARAGYVTEQQEQDGRRRKLYALTEQGRQALEEWLGVLTPEPYELRDLAVLKLFFGANVNDLATVQLETHRQKLAEYEHLGELSKDYSPEGARLALELGIRHERETIQFWSEQIEPSKRKPAEKTKAAGKPSAKPKS